jgi:hypothetical protein
MDHVFGEWWVGQRRAAPDDSLNVEWMSDFILLHHNVHLALSKKLKHLVTSIMPSKKLALKRLSRKVRKLFGGKSQEHSIPDPDGSPTVAQPASPVNTGGEAASLPLSATTDTNPANMPVSHSPATAINDNAAPIASKPAGPVSQTLEATALSVEPASPVNTGGEAPSLTLSATTNTDSNNMPVSHSLATAIDDGVALLKIVSELAGPVSPTLEATAPAVESAPSSARQTAKNIFKGTLNVLSSVLEGLPIPGAKAVVNTVIKVIAIFEVCTFVFSDSLRS